MNVSTTDWNDVLYLRGDIGDVNQMSMALTWLTEFLGFAQDVMLPFMPRLIRAILPNLAHHALIIQEDAIRANRALVAVVQRLPSHIPSVPTQQGEKTPSVRANSVSGSPAATRQPTLPKEAMSPTLTPESELAGNPSPAASERAAYLSRQRAATVPAAEQQQQQQQQTAPVAPDGTTVDQGSRSQSPSSTAASVAQTVNTNQTATTQPPTQSPTQVEAEPFDYYETVRALTPQLIPEHEATQVAALKWLTMLHKKVPRKVHLIIV